MFSEPTESIVAMEELMPDFLQGILVVLLPSMLTVAWLVWRAIPADSES
jgi:hypothetical protein